MTLPDVCDRRLILVVGKGGVGRSTVAAALATECARRGRNTLLFEVNANDRFATLLGSGGRPPVGTDIVQLAPNVSAVNTTPQAAMAEYGLMILKIKSIYELVFENRVTKAFLRAVPGLDDYAVLGKCWFHTSEERRGRPAWDTVIFDMPASGHAASMLRVPGVIVDTVPEGPLTRDARSVLALLRDPVRTAAVLVTLAEEMPVNEACEMEAKLVAMGIHPQRIACNQIYPEYFPPGQAVTRMVDALIAAPQLASPLAELAGHADLARARRALNARYLAELQRRAKTPVGELPMLFAASLGRAQIETLANAFRGP